MSLAVSVVGQASKRGLIPRLPGAGRLVEDVERWVRSEYTDTVRSIRSVPTEADSAGAESIQAGSIELRVALHPAAPDVRIVAGDTGRMTVRAETSAVGPGYHTFVCRLLQRLGGDLAIAWGPATGEGTAAAGAWHPDTIDRHDIERAHLSWLGGELVRAAEARRFGLPPIHLGTPAGTRYDVEGALATPLGPRDDAWLASALADARIAVDVWPWFSDAMDGRYLLNRALALMWSEIRWRRPADAGERTVVEETLRLLHRAHPLDPSLAFPWREWRELAGLMPTPDPMAAMLDERAASVAPAVPLIGYRRGPVAIIHDGWTILVPGSFDERRSCEAWWGGADGRSITLAAVPVAMNGRPLAAEAILRELAADLGPGALEHRSGEIVGRARLATDGSSGISIGVVEGFAAVDGSGAAIRVEFDDPADWQWALDQWRALRPA